MAEFDVSPGGDTVQPNSDTQLASSSASLAATQPPDDRMHHINFDETYYGINSHREETLTSGEIPNPGSDFDDQNGDNKKHKNTGRITYFDATSKRKQIITPSVLNSNTNEAYGKNTRLQARKVESNSRSPSIFGNKIITDDASKKQVFDKFEKTGAEGDWRRGESTQPPEEILTSPATKEDTTSLATTTTLPTTTLPESKSYIFILYHRKSIKWIH